MYAQVSVSLHPAGVSNDNQQQQQQQQQQQPRNSSLGEDLDPPLHHPRAVQKWIRCSEKELRDFAEVESSLGGFDSVRRKNC